MAEILTAAQRVVLARHIARPGTADFIAALFTDFFEQKGDRQNREDPSILGGIALYKGHPVTVIGHRKGKTLEENVAYNFGMPGPEGYRKAQRLMDQAEKFKRPVITFVDTPGAYPGLEAEALTAWLDRVGAARGARDSCSDLMRRVANLKPGDPRSLPRLFACACAVHRWKGEITHGISSAPGRRR